MRVKRTQTQRTPSKSSPPRSPISPPRDRVFRRFFLVDDTRLYKNVWYRATGNATRTVERISLRSFGSSVYGRRLLGDDHKVCIHVFTPAVYRLCVRVLLLKILQNNYGSYKWLFEFWSKDFPGKIFLRVFGAILILTYRAFRVV